MSTIIFTLALIAACLMVAFGMARDMPLINFAGCLWLAVCGYIMGKSER